MTDIFDSFASENQVQGVDDRKKRMNTSTLSTSSFQMTGSAQSKKDQIKEWTKIIRNTLWPKQDSTSLEYIQHHAKNAIKRLSKIDVQTSYATSKHIKDVEVYRVYATDPRTILQGTDSSRCEYRGATNVPGNLETIMQVLGSNDPRGFYWATSNISKGFIDGELFKTQALSERCDNKDVVVFPRWNQKMVVSEFSKQLMTPLMCHYAEYACIASHEAHKDVDSTSKRRHRRRRRGYVYRRSIDHQAFLKTLASSSSSSASNILYLEDFLYEITESANENICQVMLSCSVFLPLGDHTKQNRAAFRASCTSDLIALRQLLRMYNHTALPMNLHTIAPWKGGQIMHPSKHVCNICAGSFSTSMLMIKKRYQCITCSLYMCTKCCKTTKTNTTKKRHKEKQCRLCERFGPPHGYTKVTISDSRAKNYSSSFSFSINSGFSLRNFSSTTSSIASPPSASMLHLEEYEDEDIEEPHYSYKEYNSVKHNLPTSVPFLQEKNNARIGIVLLSEADRTALELGGNKGIVLYDPKIIH
jgi:hypothetical protein